MVPEVRIAGVATPPHRFGEKGPAGSHDVRALDVGVRGHGAELERSRRRPGSSQVAGSRCNETRRSGFTRPSRIIGTSAVPPATSRASPSSLASGVDRLAQRLGLDETERMQAHGLPRPGAAASTASMIFV